MIVYSREKHEDDQYEEGGGQHNLRAGKSIVGLILAVHECMIFTV